MVLRVLWVFGVLAAQIFASTPEPPRPACPTHLHPAVQKLREIAGQNPFRWESTIAVAGQPLSPSVLTYERAIQLLSALWDPNGNLLKLFCDETALGNDLQNPKFWDLYMRSFDLLSFSQGYVDLMTLVEAHLPDSGDILDLGGGTANHAAFWLHGKPQRRVTLIDKQGAGLSIGEAKLANFGYAAERYRIVAGDITDAAAYPPGTFGAAVFNFVLYALPAEVQKATLQMVMKRLAPGAKVLITDPLQKVAGAPAFFKAHMQSAIENGAPFTDFSMLAMLAVNTIILRGGLPATNAFHDRASMIELGTSVGLRPVSDRTAYFDGAGFYEFAMP